MHLCSAYDYNYSRSGLVGLIYSC